MLLVAKAIHLLGLIMIAVVPAEDYHILNCSVK